MNITYLCQYFVPEPGAPSARLYELSRVWVESGHNVTILTGMPNHPTGEIAAEYRGKWFAEEQLDGIRVLRSWLFATPNEGVFKKSLGHISFMLSVLVSGMPRMGAADVLIVSSPTFFSVFSAYVISRLRRIPYIFEVRDLWPAVFVDLGILTNPLLIRILEFWELFLYRRAARVVTVTESFRRDLILRGVPASDVHTITNGAAVDKFAPGPKENLVREELGLADKFVVSYVGAHGISHGLETILHAAEHLSESKDIKFLMVGEGARKKDLLRLKNELRLDNVIMLPAQPSARIAEYYKASDVCIVPLRNVSLFDTFIPSKMFEIMACGVPIIGAVRGEARSILERSGAARLVEPEDVGALVDAICRLQKDAAARESMGLAGREFVLACYDRSVLAAQYMELLTGVID